MLGLSPMLPGSCTQLASGPWFSGLDLSKQLAAHYLEAISMFCIVNLSRGYGC